MTSLRVVFLALLGLAIGSFANVVVYRVPQGLSLLRPRSHCPHCASDIAPYDNIPVLSWILLRGECRRCHAPIAVRYPLVELLTAALFVAVGQRVGWRWDLPAFLLFVAGLVVLALVDADHLLLPRRLVYPLTAMVGGWLVLDAAVTHQWHRLGVSALWGLGWWALFAGLRLANEAWMGGGDVRLAFLLGLALGWYGGGAVLIAFFAANLIGAVTGIILIAIGRTTRGQPLPFGVFLALGSLVGLFGQPWVGQLIPALR